MRKYILIIIFFVLLAFVFITYFYWTPDSIAPLVPEKALFYLHLNLNNLTREGRENADWLRECLSGNDELEIPMLSKEMVPLVDEIGWIGLAEEDVVHLALVLKPKIWEKDLVLREEERLVKKKLDSNFFVLATQDKILEEIYPRKDCFWSQPELSTRRGATGFVNLAELSGEKENILKFSARTQKNFLLFEMEPLARISQTNQTRWLDFMPYVREKLVLVVTSSEEINLNTLERRFKINLAYQKPTEREVTLPDGSKFIEFLVDPDQFYFEKKETRGKSFRYLIEPDLGFEIALSKDGTNIFISNSLALLEKTMSAGFWDEYLSDGISGALYWPIKRFGLEDLTAVEKEGRIKGCLAPY